MEYSTRNDFGTVSGEMTQCSCVLVPPLQVPVHLDSFLTVGDKELVFK